jgi:hypothetical protein
MRPFKRQASDDETLAMGDVTKRIGRELTALAQSVHHLQGLISPLILEAAARNPAHLQELQDFDHIAQKLGNLSDFLAALAQDVPDHWQVDPTAASKVITLSDLSSRLGLGEGHGSIAGDSSGDLELF